jgi:hypothetical protein
MMNDYVALSIEMFLKGVPCTPHLGFAGPKAELLPVRMA